MVDVTGSTNTDLAAAARAGAPDRSVLAARHQTAGRGRLDRHWDTPPGVNLLVSMLFRGVPDPAVRLTQRVGLAAVAAARRLSGAPAVLKWPNDVLVGDAKLAGILAQLDAEQGWVVVGLGLNVGWCPPGAARLGAQLDPLDVLAAVLAEYDALPVDDAELVERYRQNLATLGRPVRAVLAGSELHGRAVDVDEHGRLVVQPDSGPAVALDTADVVHLR